MCNFCEKQFDFQWTVNNNQKLYDWYLCDGHDVDEGDLCLDCCEMYYNEWKKTKTICPDTYYIMKFCPLIHPCKQALLPQFNSANDLDLSGFHQWLVDTNIKKWVAIPMHFCDFANFD